MQNLLLVLLHCCLNLLGLQHHLCLFRSNHTCRLSHGQESTPPIFLSRIASLSKEEAHGARPAGARPHPAGKTLGRHATRRVLRPKWLKPARPPLAIAATATCRRPGHASAPAAAARNTHRLTSRRKTTALPHVRCSSSKRCVLPILTMSGPQQIQALCSNVFLFQFIETRCL